ncbi:MAG: enoyl-CoA hydratase-related protein [Thiolinea sp.]
MIEQYYNPLICTLTTLEMPVVCAVNGGRRAGAIIALACDLHWRRARRVLSRPFCKIGLVPDSGGTHCRCIP